MNPTRRTPVEVEPTAETVASQAGRTTALSTKVNGAQPLALGPGSVVALRYTIIKEIGRGGMGAVFVARQEALDREVALKVMLPEFAQLGDFSVRFRREALIMSSISHRNIASIIDYGVFDGMPFLVLELLKGVDLEHWLAGLGRLPTLAEVDLIMSQALSALDTAHAASVVHRDIKPGNLFLSLEADGSRTLKVLDFGLARVDSGPESLGAITRTQMVSGTPAYMSPEQCRSLSVGPSTDLYALGCVLTALLQGEPPFDANTSADLIAKQMFAIPPPLRRPADAEPLPPLLEPLRLALLAKEPANRPGSAEELRKRWAEVFSSTGHRQLPSADRAARLPVWTFAEPKVISSPSLELGWVAIVMVGPPPHDLAKDGVRIALELAGLRLQTASLADVILLDASTDGESAIAYLRASDRPQTPIVVCLKTGGGDELAALIAAGAADVLAYPVEVSRLVPKLRRIQSRRRWAK
jgi:CheY-like chemotaxis protein